MGLFDQAARYACGAEPRAVARRLLRKVRQRLQYQQFHNTRTSPLPGQRDRTVDGVLALDNLDAPQKPALVILEFQSGHDEDKLHSTLVSVAHMAADVRHGPDRKGRFQVFAALVYLRDGAPETEIDMALTDTDGQRLAGTWHRTLFWNVAEDDADEALAEVEADLARCWGLLFWVVLMRNAALAANIARWLAQVGRLTNKRDRADLGRIALVFAELAGTLHEWREALKEFDMQDSQVVLEWTADAVRKAEVRTLRETLLRLAQTRFKGDLSEEDKHMISTQQSTDVLDDWLDAVVESNTYAEFRAFLRR